MAGAWGTSWGTSWGLSWLFATPAPLPTSTGTFLLDVSTLAGIQYSTIPFDLDGEFRDIQLHWSQSVSSQDMEPHFLELHFTLAGVDEAL